MCAARHRTTTTDPVRAACGRAPLSKIMTVEPGHDLDLEVTSNSRRNRHYRQSIMSFCEHRRKQLAPQHKPNDTDQSGGYQKMTSYRPGPTLLARARRSINLRAHRRLNGKFYLCARGGLYDRRYNAVGYWTRGLVCFLWTDSLGSGLLRSEVGIR
jgi:hypothetical protein